jgi:serine-type D-Ala-D-Ala carboxypeptidase (penicillin-binding protein 5/6)
MKNLRNSCVLLCLFSLLVVSPSYAAHAKKSTKSVVKKRSVKKSVAKKVEQDNADSAEASSPEARNAKMVRNLQEAQFYFLLDADTKEVLLSKNPDARIPPSSMTKVMTAYVVFDQVKNGRVSLDNQCMIGKDAWRKSGSSMFLNYGDIVTIDELMRGLLAVSGNDAAIALAETTAGGINNFVSLMNQKAKDIGLTNSHFKNPHGLAEEGHYMSVRDLATLTSRIYQDFPQYSHYLGIQEFTYRNIKQINRNPLIKGNYDGVLGGKTGHTDAGGYGVLGAVKRDDRMLIAVVNKAPTPKKRAALIFDLMDYGFENYNKLTLFNKDQEVTDIPTWMGSDSEVKATVNDDVAFNVPRGKALDNINVTVKYKGPLYAPVAKGDRIGTLLVEIKGYKNLEYPLFAKESVDKAGYLKRISQILRYKMAGISKIFDAN